MTEESTEVQEKNEDKKKKSFFYPIKTMSGQQKAYFFGGMIISFMLGRYAEKTSRS